MLGRRVEQPQVFGRGQALGRAVRVPALALLLHSRYHSRHQKATEEMTSALARGQASRKDMITLYGSRHLDPTTLEAETLLSIPIPGIGRLYLVRVYDLSSWSLRLFVSRHLRGCLG